MGVKLDIETTACDIGNLFRHHQVQDPTFNNISPIDSKGCCQLSEPGQLRLAVM
jgi:hypothetical protein